MNGISEIKRPIEDIADSLGCMNSKLEKIGSNINSMNNNGVTLNEIVGEKIVPIIRHAKENDFELEMIKNANDTIVKLLEIKKMYNTQEISFEEYSISTTAIVANLKFGVKDQRTECIFKNVLVCLPDNMRSKFKSGEKEAEK